MAGSLSSLTEGLTITNFADWLLFVQRLQEAVRSGRAKKIAAMWCIWVQGEEWYVDTENGDVFAYVEPDAPILPMWRKIDIWAGPSRAEPCPNNLSVIPAGTMSDVETGSLKTVLSLLVHQGSVEVLSPKNVANSERVTEKWFKDKRTNLVYRLIEKSRNCS